MLSFLRPLRAGEQWILTAITFLLHHLDTFRTAVALVTDTISFILLLISILTVSNCIIARHIL